LREEQKHYLNPEDIPEEMRDNPDVRRFFKKVGETLEMMPMQLRVFEQFQEVIALDRLSQDVVDATLIPPEGVSWPVCPVTKQIDETKAEVHHCKPHAHVIQRGTTQIVRSA